MEHKLTHRQLAWHLLLFVRWTVMPSDLATGLRSLRLRWRSVLVQCLMTSYRDHFVNELLHVVVRKLDELFSGENSGQEPKDLHIADIDLVISLQVVLHYPVSLAPST